MKANLTWVGLLAVVLCGCMHTVVGGHSYSPDNHYHLWISSHGASGKAYVDKSKKKIAVGIESGEGTNSSVLFAKWYTLTGSDIAWDIHWLSNDSVSVVFYDWGDGVSNYNNMHHLSTSNNIVSLSFVLDPRTGKFIEKK